MGELVNTNEVLNTVQVLERETQRLQDNGIDEYGMPLRSNPPTHDPRQYYTTPFLINKLRSIIPIEIDLFLQTANLEFYRGEPEDPSPPLSLLRIGYLWYDDDDEQPIEPLFVADKGAYYSDRLDLVPYNASGECRRALVAQDGFWGSGILECFNTCNGTERTNINLASGMVQTLIQFMFMLGDRRRYFWYEQPHDAAVDVHVEQLVHVIKTATHDRMYPHMAKRNPRPMVPRPPPPSPADADDGTGLAEAERLQVLQWRLQEMGERQEREHMQQMQMQSPIDPRLLADTPGMPNSRVGPGTQDMTSGISGTSGENGSSGSGRYAAVGNEFSSAETGGWGPPADNGALPVGSGYPPADDGYAPASNAHPPAGGFDLVFQAGGGPSYAAPRNGS
jgi:hypothetical protein